MIKERVSDDGVIFVILGGGFDSKNSSKSIKEFSFPSECTGRIVGDSLPAGVTKEEGRNGIRREEGVVSQRTWLTQIISKENGRRSTLGIVRIWSIELSRSSKGVRFRSDCAKSLEIG